MRTRSRRLILIALPLCPALALWPVAHRYQERARAQATFELRAAINRNASGQEHLNPAVVETLIRQGGDVNVRGINALTLLHSTATKPWDDGLVPPAQPRDTESARIALLRFLLAHGANVNVRSLQGMTPLMVAAYHSRLQAVKLLLANGARANLNQYENEKPGPGEKPEVRTALTIARENLGDTQADDPEGDTRQIIALLQAAETREKRS